MRKIAATYVFPVTQPPIKNGILICEDDGTIVEIIDKGDQFREEAGVEFHGPIQSFLEEGKIEWKWCYFRDPDGIILELVEQKQAWD